MDRLRRQIIVSGMMGAAGLLTGCLTTKLFEQERYSEDISSVLISQDGKKLVVIGRQHHYVFEAPQGILQTLRSPFHKSVAASFGRFGVAADGRTTGQYGLFVGKDAPNQDQADALAAGYKPDKDDGFLSLRGKLKGIRYNAGNVDIPSVAQKLNRTYRVDITVDPSAVSTAAKVLLTPITVAADGVLILAGIPLLVIALRFDLVDF
jgi:hypothetical protein